jgi:2,3-bisphosphoglycerate-dependent phosphoglycerate mutase
MLILLRHGESEWNRTTRFTGWADVDLSAAGEAEAERAGRVLRRHGYRFDCCFTSVLRRAVRSSEIVLRTMGLEHIPVERSWRLNERHYGGLQGLGLCRAVGRYGLLPVLRVRRQATYRPPALDPEDARFPGRDPRYARLPPEDLPRAESLEDTQARLAPFWRERIVPELARGRRVLVVSHKNTLRALLAELAGPDGPRARLRIATGVPIVLALDPALAVLERRVLRGERVAASD